MQGLRELVLEDLAARGDRQSIEHDIGSTQYCTSADVMLRSAAVVWALNSRLRWVSMTPFRVPVVPEV